MKDEALAAPVQDLPFGVGGGLVAIKTLLSRDPCVHANTAIEMIDAILKEHTAAPPVQEPVAWEAIEKVAQERYKIVPSDSSMFYRFAVVAGDGNQQLFIGRETECQIMARKFAGAFLDGAFMQERYTTTPPAAAVQEGRDWSLLEATQESLREHMAEIKRLKAAQPAPVQPVVFYRCNGCGHAYEQVHPTSCDCMEAGGFDRVEYFTTPPAQPAPNCTRSHPHESMDAMCELRTEIARLTNENARLKAQPAPVQEPHKGLSEHLAQATNGRVYVDPVTGDVGIGTPAAPVQEPVAEVGEDMKGGGYVKWLSEDFFVPGTKLYTTPPAAAPVEDVDWKEQYEKQKRRSDMWVAKYEKDIGPIEYAAPAAAQPAPVPDAIHHTDLSESLEYIQGWNDCRAEMLGGKP
jgi:hypothetical protein